MQSYNVQYNPILFSTILHCLVQSTHQSALDSVTQSIWLIIANKLQTLILQIKKLDYLNQQLSASVPLPHPS